MDAPLLLLCTSLLIAPSLQGLLQVNPDKSQFSQGSPLLVRCNDVKSEVWRKTSQGSRGRCEKDWGDRSGPWCRVDRLASRDSGQYWCQSAEGDDTETVDIIVAGSGAVLEMTVHPVPSGESVSLVCRHLAHAAQPARFYKNGQLLKEERDARMTLQKVALSDKGQYHCAIKEDQSAPSQLRIIPVKVASTVSPALSSPSPSAPPASPSPPSLSHLLPVVASVVGLVLLILLLLLVLLVRRCRRKKAKGQKGKRRKGQSPASKSKQKRGKSRNQKQPRKCPKCQNVMNLQPFSQ